MNLPYFCIKKISLVLNNFILFIVLVISTTVSVFGADPLAYWAFESNYTGWLKASTTNLQLSDFEARKVLNVNGTTTGGTVVSSPWPGSIVTPNSFIEVSGLFNISSCNSNTYIKVSFLDANKAGVSYVISNSYDSIRSGTWQKLMATVQVPANAYTVNLTIIQAAATSVNVYIDDVTISYTDKIKPLGPYTDTPVPTALQSFSGVHPRLFVTSAIITDLKSKIQTDPYSALWLKCKTKVDAIPAPSSVFPSCSSASSQRTYGYNLPKLAFAWLVTGNSNYLNSATTIATAMANASSWGDCSALNKDHVTGVVLLGLSLYYDWCYDVISTELKTSILNKIKSVSSIMAESLISGSYADPWWKNAYLCNQMPVAIVGLSAAGLATFDELNDSSAWIQLTVDKIENLLNVRANDGTFVEGVGYWGYDVESLLKSLHLFRQPLGRSYYENQWVQHTGMFRLYMGLPRNLWTRSLQVVDFDDSLMANWYGPDTILRCLAKEYQNPYLQWLANEVDKNNYTDDISEWLNLLWIDPALSSENPSALPTLRHFEDLGVVSARSDWSGNEALLVYTAGPLTGHKSLGIPTPGNLFTEHMHPDNGHFVLFGKGDQLLRDDSYWDDTGLENPKAAKNHNTLIIDGGDQLHASSIFSNKAKPSISGTYSDELYHLIKSDLTQAYISTLGLTKFKRTVIFVKPDFIIVVDDIALSASHNLDLMFHTKTLATEQDGSFIATGQNSYFRLEDFPKTGVTRYSGNMLYSNGRLTMPTVKYSKTSSSWRNATVLSWSGKDVPPPRVTMTEMGSEWIFKTSIRTITFNWDTEDVSVSAGSSLLPPINLRAN